MKAVYLNEHGGLDKLQVGELPAPSPKPDEVQVQIKAAALNRLDLFTLAGIPGLKIAYPHIPGADGAGVISALGEGVIGIDVGHPVVINATIHQDPEDENVRAGRDNMARQGGILGEHYPGTLAEYVCVPARNVLPMPAGFPFEDAAAASLVYLTAWHSLVTRGGLQPDEHLLIVGAGGGVNSASIQIGKLRGATVTVVGSNAAKLEAARNLGADHVIDRSEQPEWSKAVYQITNKRGVDVVVDNVGKATIGDSLRALARGGRVLVVGGTSGYDAGLPVNLIFGKHLSIIGSTMGTQRDFTEVMGLIFAGKLHAVIGQVYGFDEARAAFEALQKGEVFGKIVLRP